MTSLSADQLAEQARRYLSHPPHPRVAALAIPLFQRAVALAPARIDLRLDLATAYFRLGQSAQAIETCDETLARYPDAVEARLFRCMYQIRIVYHSAAEVTAAREAYGYQLAALTAMIDREPARLERLAGWIHRARPFYLPYQGENDVELQRTYGSLACRAMAAACPDWTGTRAMPPAPPGSPLRVGVVSGYFRNHAIWSAIIRGWLTGLDASRFALHGYSLSARQDTCTAEARHRCARFHAGERSFRDWCETISADRLHVLLYPEVCEHALATRLAMLRLAPVQGMAGGHCVTSGLPTMDYYLGGDLMEPADAASHYSERLVRLPNLGYAYRQPLVAPPQRIREDFGLRPEAVVYLSPHSVFKYLPQHDGVYADIAERVRDSQLVFVKHLKVEALSRQLERRITAAFTARGLDPKQHLVFLPRMGPSAYNDIQCLADIYLDAIGWNGGTTTATALGYGLPAVTLSGPVSRGRMGTAMLRRLGIFETIAGTPAGYVDIAARLGHDKHFRRELRQRVGAANHLLYDDPAYAGGLASFLEKAVAGSPGLSSSASGSRCGGLPAQEGKR
ncbi:MAG: tetratricopeptide repeat protein [Candidatus Schekmanbacteria bacterium]|nr:tetratricopeptide repeat protein [Candidatus Schekmanbacteria bacterium]